MQQATAVPAAGVEVKGLHKHFGGVGAVDDISFALRTGEFVTLLGPSGCGKTTTLRCIAGLELPDGGEIWVNGHQMSGPGVFVPPEKRNIGMVFQSYAVWPHMTVFENVAYGLRLRRVARGEMEDRVTTVLDMVGLGGQKQRLATQLSGGQQQRVALARAMVVEPQVLLLDEPLSNLDAKLRERMRLEIRELQQRLGKTAVYVTHDQAEAMAVSDRILLLRDGRISQEGTARELYEEPRSKFVADFVGLANFLRGRLVGRLGGLACIDLGHDTTINSSRIPDALGEGEEVTVMVRPERIEIVENDGKENCWRVAVAQHVYLGGVSETYLRFGNTTLRLQHQHAEVTEYAKLYIHIPPQNVLYVPDDSQSGPEQ